MRRRNDLDVNRAGAMPCNLDANDDGAKIKIYF
jgi:hypothetical protein